MSHERFESLDIFWSQPKQNFSPKICYIFLQGEFGFIPYIASSAICGNKKPIVEIMSPNMSVEPFNRMPNMVKSSWNVTQVSSNTCFVNITSFPTIKMLPDANPQTWRSTYSMMMDLLLWLEHNGCKQINFLTSMNTSSAEQESDLMVYDLYNDIRPEVDLLTALPAWFIPSTWHMMGGKACVICVIQDEGQYIDQDAYALLEEYLMALGLPYDNVHKERITQVLLSVRDRVEAIEDTFELFDEDGGDWS